MVLCRCLVAGALLWKQRSQEATHSAVDLWISVSWKCRVSFRVSSCRVYVRSYSLVGAGEVDRSHNELQRLITTSLPGSPTDWLEVWRKLVWNFNTFTIWSCFFHCLNALLLWLLLLWGRKMWSLVITPDCLEEHRYHDTMGNRSVSCEWLYGPSASVLTHYCSGVSWRAAGGGSALPACAVCPRTRRGALLCIRRFRGSIFHFHRNWGKWKNHLYPTDEDHSRTRLLRGGQEDFCQMYLSEHLHSHQGNDISHGHT